MVVVGAHAVVAVAPVTVAAQVAVIGGAAVSVLLFDSQQLTG